MSNKVLLTGDARVFVAERGAGCGREYAYYNCMKMGGISKSFGEINPIYCPADIGGDFIQVDSFRGDESAWTTSLSGYKPLAARSVLQRLSRRKQPVDVQVHFGSCIDLSEFSAFQSALIIEDATFSGYNIDSLGALNGGEVAPVLETVNLTAANIYEVFCLKLLQVARSQTEQGVVADVTTCPEGCGTDCLVPCSVFYAWRFSGTPSVAGNGVIIMRSVDGGLTWTDYTFDVPTFDPLGSALSTFHIACSGRALFLIGNEVDDHRGAIYRIDLNDFDDGIIDDYRRIEFSSAIEQVTMLGGVLYAMVSGTLHAVNTDSLSRTQIYLASAGAWEYMSMVDAQNFLLASTLGALDAYRNGVFTHIDCLTVSGISVNCQVSAVVMRSPNEWFVATCDGSLHCTVDAGLTWRTIVQRTAAIVDIKFATKNVGYYLTRSPCQVFRTIDGGATWDLVNDYAGQVDPTIGYWHSLTVCSQDPNVFIAAGRVTATTPEDCSDPEGSCQHTCEVIAITDDGILVSGQVC